MPRDPSSEKFLLRVPWLGIHSFCEADHARLVAAVRRGDGRNVSTCEMPEVLPASAVPEVSNASSVS
jgi:hypothetical protein